MPKHKRKTRRKRGRPKSKARRYQVLTGGEKLEATISPADTRPNLPTLDWIANREGIPWAQVLVADIKDDAAEGKESSPDPVRGAWNRRKPVQEQSDGSAGFNCGPHPWGYKARVGGE